MLNLIFIFKISHIKFFNNGNVEFEEHWYCLPEAIDPQS